jgi:selenocysteine-specific elongation factor
VSARGVQTLGRPTDRAVGVSRVALNLRGIDRTDVRRGDALVTPAAWSVSDLVDVHVVGADARALPMRLVLHIGSASLGASVRPLGERAARLALDHALPLRIGDRALLRDPGAHRIPAAVLVADLTPPALRRRGDARRRAEFLGGPGGALDGAGELRRRGVVSGPGLRRAGVSPPVPPVIVDWYVDPDLLPRLQERLRVTVEDYRTQHPLESGPPLETVRQALDVPDARVVEALLTPPHALNAGRIVSAGSVSELPPGVAASVAVLEQELAAAPFVAPDAPHLAALGLGPREVAAAVRAGRLLKLADGVVLLPRAEIAAVERLATLPQPFTVAAARQALDTSRRVAVPLLELLDRHKLTRRLPDDRREVVADVRDLRRT